MVEQALVVAEKSNELQKIYMLGFNLKWPLSWRSKMSYAKVISAVLQGFKMNGKTPRETT